MLSRDGYDLLEASDAAAAVEVITPGEHAIDPVVLDAVLPEPGSQAVIDALRAQREPLRVLVMSAYDASALRGRRVFESLGAFNGFPFLEKPFTWSDLATAVAKLLAGQRTRCRWSPPPAGPSSESLTGTPTKRSMRSARSMTASAASMCATA